MVRYTPIRAVLDYIPSSIKSQASESDMISWAFQGYRALVYSKNTKYDKKFVVTKVDSHKAKLPLGVLKVDVIAYSLNKPTKLDSSTGTTVAIPFINHANLEDSRAIVQQTLILNDLNYLCTPMKYVGQNPELLSQSCLNLYSECFTNWSISKDMRTITTDANDGYISVVYSVLAEDDGDFLIPDSPELLEGLGLWAEAQGWRNRAGTKEQYANNLYTQRKAEAIQWVRKFRSSRILKNLNPDRYADLIFQSNNIKHHPTISGNNRNYGR